MRWVLSGSTTFHLRRCYPPILHHSRQYGKPAQVLGTQAAKLLFDHIENPEGNRHQAAVKMVLPVEFIIRTSCGCAGGPNTR